LIAVAGLRRRPPSSARREIVSADTLSRARRVGMRFSDIRQV
jgi:hypothetical protein